MQYRRKLGWVGIMCVSRFLIKARAELVYEEILKPTRVDYKRIK